MCRVCASSICSPCTDGYLAGNVRSVGIRLGVIEGEAEDCASWDALWEGKDYACALCNEEESGELACLWGGGGRISFWCKVKGTALVLIPWEGNQKCFPFLCILFCLWEVGFFGWIFFPKVENSWIRGRQLWEGKMERGTEGMSRGIQKGWFIGVTPFPWSQAAVCAFTMLEQGMVTHFQPRPNSLYPTRAQRQFRCPCTLKTSPSGSFRSLSLWGSVHPPWGSCCLGSPLSKPQIPCMLDVLPSVDGHLLFLSRKL